VEVCKGLEDLGDLAKWNIDRSEMSDFEKMLEERKSDLKLSSQSLEKFHQKYFYD
jgi:hypothetical protein